MQLESNKLQMVTIKRKHNGNITFKTSAVCSQSFYEQIKKRAYELVDGSPPTDTVS